MTTEEVFKAVQDYINDPPLMLIGTGASIPMGISGMWKLAQHLQCKLDEKYASDVTWSTVSEKLNSGSDLESALTDCHLNVELLNDIKCATWELVTRDDLKLFREKVLLNAELPLATIIRKLIGTSRGKLDIITTNYDRYIEYCCDRCGLKIDNRYSGMYRKQIVTDDVRKRDIVNLLKVHGSLDSFTDNLTGESISIPLQESIPNGFTPEIITPGSDKYQTLLTTTSNRAILHVADSLISNATNFLCIGYGFNDSQIQQNIITKIKSDTPIVVVTRELSDNAFGLISNNSKNFAVILDGGDNNTRFIINREETLLNGSYWTLDGFKEII